MENKIKEILNNRADYYIDSNGKSHDIIRGHPDDIMDEIVKLFAIPAVVGRSEQLSCGRNITTCVFYKDGSKCSNLEYCKDQTT